MQMFEGHRTLDAIQRLCDEQGVELRREKYDRGDDYISLHTPGVIVCYDPIFGRFIGSVEMEGQKVHFSSDIDCPDDWYQALLNFFYIGAKP